ncbi:MAG TPA: hypothetical protein VN368_02665 [Candidatus Methylomirabilis sp.]|nr:hypothetical protein [Candidatus Methylomirabilis sp.]
MDEYGTVASIDGMLSVMIIVTGLAFMFALPGLIGYSADMQQGFQITAKSIQAMDIGKAIIFSEEGQKAAFAYAKEPPPDDGKTKAQGRYDGKTAEEWLGELGIDLSSNDFDVYMKMESMEKFTPVMEVHTNLTDLKNAKNKPEFLIKWIKKSVYNLMYDYVVGGARLHGKFNTQITTDYGKVILLIEKGSEDPEESKP